MACFPMIDSSFPAMSPFTFPPYFLITSTKDICWLKVSVLLIIPLGRDLRHNSSKIIKSRPCLPSLAIWATVSSDGSCIYDRLPAVTFITLPPNLYPGSREELVRLTLSVFFIIPFVSQARIYGQQIVNTLYKLTHTSPPAFRVPPQACL